jgi:hypothetical protein
MDLETFLKQQKESILKKWFDQVIGSYSPESSKLFTREKNQFANPVGHTISHAMEGLFDEFFFGSDTEKVSSFLDKIIRIRAIQDFSPSQAVAFIFLLKKVIREEADVAIRENRLTHADLMTFEARIDDLALQAFDIYMACREKLYEVRVGEFKNRTFRLLQRANLLTEISPEQKPEQDGNT